MPAPAPITIQPFTGPHTHSLLACWSAALFLDAITQHQLETRVLLDDNFHPDGLLIALQGPHVLGFISCFTLQKPIEKTGLLPDRGYIQALGVHPAHQRQGIGTRLLHAAEQFFRAHGRSQIVLSPYTPNYFVPGVDKDNYPHGLAFLQRHGFTEYSEALAADALISTFQLTPALLQKEAQLAAQGTIIRSLRPTDIASYLTFQRQHMPGPWVEDARRLLREISHGRAPHSAIWIAEHTPTTSENESPAPQIIGFCQHEHEHFGPFGIIDEHQGRGIGTLLLAHTLHSMRTTGCHSAWVLWTGHRALDGIYGRLGFRLTRKFAIMKKELAP